MKPNIIPSRYIQWLVDRLIYFYCYIDQLVYAPLYSELESLYEQGKFDEARELISKLNSSLIRTGCQTDLRLKEHLHNLD